MTDTLPPPFSAFSATIGRYDGRDMICIISVSHRDSHQTWFDPPEVRKFAAHLVQMADKLEPLPKQWVLKTDGDVKLAGLVDTAKEASRRTKKSRSREQMRRSKR